MWCFFAAERSMYTAAEFSDAVEIQSIAKGKVEQAEEQEEVGRGERC